jgi:hypothetical protein
MFIWRGWAHRNFFCAFCGNNTESEIFSPSPNNLTLKIEVLWISLSAVVACLPRRSNSGREGWIGHYGEVGSLRPF